MNITLQQPDREPGDLSRLARRTEREQAAAAQAKERADDTREQQLAFIRQLTGKTDQATSTTDKEN